jgi:hypothetical protein
MAIISRNHFRFGCLRPLTLASRTETQGDVPWLPGKRRLHIQERNSGTMSLNPQSRIYIAPRSPTGLSTLPIGRPVEGARAALSS